MDRVQDTYVCESCGETFESERSLGEAEAEMRQQWGDLPHHERSILCDDCYEQFMDWMAAK